MTNYTSTVLCLGNSKQASLYFDRVIVMDPMSLSPDQQDMDYLKGKDPKESFLLMGSLWGNLAGFIEDDKVTNLPKILEYFKFFGEILRTVNLRMGWMGHDRGLYSRLYTENTEVPGFGEFRDIALRFIRDMTNISSVPIVLPSDIVLLDEPHESDVTIALTNIEIVDTTRSHWEQILEIRKDRESLTKLRNLRLFMHQNYTGKHRAYIEDDIGKRIDDYRIACKEHGLETCLSTLSALFNAKSLNAVVAGGLMTAILGKPGIGASIGAVLETFNVGIAYARARHAFHKFKRDHPLAYIFETKKKLAQNSNDKIGYGLLT